MDRFFLLLANVKKIIIYSEYHLFTETINIFEDTHLKITS